MNITFVKTTMDDIKPMFERYLKTITGVVEDFWESHITNADIYTINSDGNKIGCFAIHNNEKLTLFYMEDDYLFLSQTIFKDILSKFNIKTAYVTTGDLLFLSLCLDNHQKIEMQAYFFDIFENNGVRPAEYGRECIQKVETSELDNIKQLTGGFFNFVTPEEMENETIMLYKLCDNNEVLGCGILLKTEPLKEYWGCGMITLEQHRQKGVGRSIQIHLADICKENGVLPLSSCWYYNDLSKKTIESAGRYSKTRLLNIIF